MKEYTAYTSTCYDARSLDPINTDAATRAEQLIGREQLDHRRHALDVAAARRRREARRQARSQNGHTRGAMIVTVGNPTFAARPCRGHRAVPAKKLVRKFGACHATLVVDENMTSQVSFRFCLCFL